MNRLSSLFQNKKSDILNVYFTAGFPNLEDTGEIIRALGNNGVDLIEVGMPYSDPLADGATIQLSGAKALANGMSLEILFKQIKEARRNSNVPIILMGYINQVMQFGEEKFFKMCAASGVDGLILPDLPIADYDKKFKVLIAESGLTFSFLITPQTPVERIKLIDKFTTGFIYVVSSYAITGAKTGITPEQIEYFKRIKCMKLNNPRLIGFGISDKKTFDIACAHAQGAIIGSAFIRTLERGAERGQRIDETVSEFINAVRGVSSLV